jgi:hypothetical protein
MLREEAARRTAMPQMFAADPQREHENRSLDLATWLLSMPPASRLHNRGPSHREGKTRWNNKRVKPSLISYGVDHDCQLISLERSTIGEQKVEKQAS